MKKILLLISIFLLSISGIAQKISTLQPTLVVWKTNGEKISLNDAKYGVYVGDSLAINMYFHQYYFENIKDKENLQLEFRWYYYLSTRRSLMSVEKVSYRQAKKIPNNVIMFKSVQKNLQSGWWEVQVVNSNDAGFVSIAKVSKFQIFVKK